MDERGGGRRVGGRNPLRPPSTTAVVLPRRRPLILDLVGPSGVPAGIVANNETEPAVHGVSRRGVTMVPIDDDETRQRRQQQKLHKDAIDGEEMSSATNPNHKSNLHLNRHHPAHHHRIIFGTAALVKAENPLELLDAAYEKGFRRFDLARTYGGGASERIFGRWMVDRKIDRHSVDITTKGGMGQDKYGNPHRPLLTRSSFQEEVQTSLDALQTDFVDMYMFHRDDPRIDVGQFVLWANELVVSRKTKKWGVSNWSFDRLRRAYHFAIQHGLEPPLANSPQFSLAVPQCEVWPTTHSLSSAAAGGGTQQHPSSSSDREIIEWCEDHHIELQCWEVLAKGFMAKPQLWEEDDVDPTSFDRPVELGSDEWRLQRIQRAYCHPMNYHRRHRAVQLAKKLGYTLSQIATLYILSRGRNVNIIFGSNNLDHLDDMVELGLYDTPSGLKDDDEEIKALLSRLATADAAGLLPTTKTMSAKTTTTMTTTAKSNHLHLPLFRLLDDDDGKTTTTATGSSDGGIIYRTTNNNAAAAKNETFVRS